MNEKIIYKTNYNDKWLIVYMIFYYFMGLFFIYLVLLSIIFLNSFLLIPLLPILFFLYILPSFHIQNNILITENRIKLEERDMFTYWKKKEVSIPITDIKQYYINTKSITFQSKNKNLGTFSASKNKYKDDLRKISIILLKKGVRQSYTHPIKFYRPK